MTPEIEKRIKAVKAGRLPAAHCLDGKKSQWNHLQISDLFDEVCEKNHPDADVLTIIQGTGTVLREESGREIIYDENSLASYKFVKKDDFIIHLRSFEGGLEVANQDGIVSPAYIILRPKIDVSTVYLYALFHSNQFINQTMAPTVEGARDGRSVKYDVLKKQKIFLPPFSEQKKIAEILSAQDKIIELKEKLITEKQHQKKYLMQTLLNDNKSKFKINGVTIDKRKWNEMSLSDCCLKDAQYGLNAPACEFRENLPKYIRITDIDENGRYNKQSMAYADVADYKDYLLKENDILLVRTGSTTGKSYLYEKNDGKLVFAGFLIKFSINPNIVDRRIVYACLNTMDYWKWVGVMSMRSGQPGINANEYSKYKFKIPLDKNEQKVIAEVLSSADEEISLLQRDLEQEKHKKKSLMQLLLTGLVRV